jgi:precorrin-3B synthase
MTESASKRGFVPHLFAPMAAGDGWLVRIKPPGGQISAASARAVAEAACTFGNGFLQITQRANLQLRGLKRPEQAAPLAARMQSLGLASPTPAQERLRNILVSPLSGDDPSIAGEPLAVAAALAARMAEVPALARLPPKFGFVVDGGGILPLSGARAEVRIELDAEGGTLRCRVSAQGETILCDIAEASAAACAFAARFASEQPERRASARAAGWGEFLPPQRAVGFLAYAGTEHGAFGLAPAFGVLTAEMLAHAADLAGRFADGRLRLSPWRSILLGGVRAAEQAALAERAGAAGFIVDPSDRRLALITCIGAPFCAQARMPTLAEAAHLAASLPPGAALVHLSGCPKGCAAPSLPPLVWGEGKPTLLESPAAPWPG